MRQAGRILPQYRALRASVNGFKTLVKTPDLAAEVTIQPIDEIGMDAAIIFSDILVIPEAMGLPYEIVESVGPRFKNVIENEKNIDDLISGSQVLSELNYVFDAIRETRKRLEGRVPLIGFCGAPWTILCYMIEGKGSKTFSKARALLYKNEASAQKLLTKITESSIVYLKEKIKAGADVLQIFDSWAGLLSPYHYQKFALPHIQRMCEEIDEVPIIVFSKGAHASWPVIANRCKSAIGLDWTIPGEMVRKQIRTEVVVQGNADPCLLYDSEENIHSETLRMMKMLGPNHIVNLGHGVYPDTPLNGVKQFVQSVKSYSYI
jgi:uroporphyrinogen decarboxylase